MDRNYINCVQFSGNKSGVRRSIRSRVTDVGSDGYSNRGSWVNRIVRIIAGIFLLVVFLYAFQYGCVGVFNFMMGTDFKSMKEINDDFRGYK